MEGYTAMRRVEIHRCDHREKSSIFKKNRMMEFVPLHPTYPKIYKYSRSILISDVYETSMLIKIKEI